MASMIADKRDFIFPYTSPLYSWEQEGLLRQFFFRFTQTHRSATENEGPDSLEHLGNQRLGWKSVPILFF